AIITASDGAVWFTENNAAAPKLGRLSSSGVLNEYPLTGAGSATGLTQDSQGLFVVVDTAKNSVGRFDPITLAYNEYPITTANAGPEWVTVGPDGRVYVTETTANQIGQFSYF
ncbi:MAG TPA: hypothetical protein VFE17_12710, partial [Candidatus Baltobacteraceae bacterium]|nr:hypothetical protein [Candidatus Baltobacteraceae bacterium]